MGRGPVIRGRVALGDLVTQRSTRRVGLAPLTPDAVGVLAGGSGLETAALYRLTGGNPFYVTEVVAAGMGAVPASARDAVLARAARLSSPAREVLDIAALTGARVELRLLESVTACTATAIDELLASGLLAGNGGWLRFRHEIARLAVAQAVAAHRAGVIHARILDALRVCHCDDEARLAFHAEAAGDGAAVQCYAAAAARRAADLGSHREAAAQYQRALRFSGGTDPAAAAGLYDGLARELSLIDRWQDAAEAGERALELWRAVDDRLGEGDTMRRLSGTMWRLCRGREAAVAAQAAVSILEPLGPGTELAWAYASLAVQRLSSGENQAAIELAQHAQAIAEPLGAAEVLSDALNTEGCAAAVMDRSWTRQLRRALEIAISAGVDEQAGLAFANLCSIYCSERRFAEAQRYFVDGIAYCDEHDIGTFATCLRGGQTDVMTQTGRWDEAVALSAELLSDRGASPINRICPPASLGAIRARRGDPGPWECLDEALAAPDGSGEPSQ